MSVDKVAGQLDLLLLYEAMVSHDVSATTIGDVSKILCGKYKYSQPEALRSVYVPK
jgi:hypothetical protein